MRQYIYVAMPYTAYGASVHDIPRVTLENVRRAMRVADAIMAKGHVPILPHLSHFWHLETPRSYKEWIDYGMALLKLCDAVYYQPSPGADRECEAAADKTIYIRLEEIPNA